jgi:tetratricopeptide (TPR) repeat protein
MPQHYLAVDAAEEPGMKQVGVAVISKQLHEGVTKYHAQIGENVPHSELVKLETKLTKEGSKACYAQQWDYALNCFTHALAVSEKTKSTADPGCRGTFVHNIGFCLHCMGEFDAAREYYEQAIDYLQRVELPMRTKILNGVLYPERLVFELMFVHMHMHPMHMNMRIHPMHMNIHMHPMHTCACIICT